MVGILSNEAASAATRSLAQASNEARLSITRLSSGNRIAQASDDVAGLALGTALRTDVSTLRTVLTSASQANSLLQIADGGLQNIGEILQRQKALSAQANTGTLSDSERVFLDEEFQNLTSEINRLVGSTNFNGIKLLDGSVSGNAGVTTATESLSTTYTIDSVSDYVVTGSVDASSELASSSTVGIPSTIGTTAGVTTVGLDATEGVENNDTLTINGTTVTLSTGAQDLANNVIGGLTGGAGNRAADLRLIATALNSLAQQGRAGIEGHTYSVDAGNFRLVVTNNTLGGAAATISETVTTTASTISSDGTNGSVVAASTTVSTFSQDLQGQVSNISAQFIAGTVTNATDGFISNSVRFSAEINGTTYISQNVVLEGGSSDGAGTANGTGVGSLGDKIAAGTVITFLDPASAATNPGFTLTIDSDGITFAGATQAAVETELQTVSQNIETALSNGSVTIGINAPSTSFQNYSLNATSDFSGSGVAASGFQLQNGISIPSVVGATAANTTVTLTGVTDADSLNIGGTFVSIVTTATGAANEIVITDVADDTDGREIVAALNASTDSNLQNYTYEYAAGTDTLTITAKDLGTSYNPTVTGTIAGAALVEGGAMTNTAGTDAALPTTFQSSLVGTPTNFDVIFTAGSYNGADDFTANTAKFIASVGGVTYESQTVTFSGGNANATAANGSGYNNLGDRLTGGQVITFTDPLDSTSVAFQITLDVDGYNLTGTSQSQVETELGALAEGFGTGLVNGNVTIDQTREVASFDVSKVDGTVLNGLSASNVQLTSPDFNADGSHGQIGSFTVDHANDKIFVTIDGQNYSQTLSDTVANGGLGSRYDTVNNIILGGFATTLTLASEGNTSDGRQITLNLQNVNDIDMSSAAGAAALETALNNAFNVGDQTALNFQVGLTSSDNITVKIDSATTGNIYRDDNGNAVTLSIATAAGASAASDVLDNAIDSITSLRAQVGALQSRFNYVSANVETSIQNTEAARSQFLDTDFAEESTKLALKQVQTQAGIAILAQANQIPSNYLTLLQ